MRRPSWIVCVVFGAVLFFTSGISAQENATITGTVTDPSGAAVPNVTITLTNPATGQARNATSNNSGIYSFSNVGIGHFTLSATATGFQSFVRTDLVVNVAQSLKEDIALTVGTAGQTVTVRADALQVQSETSELSTLISGQQVSQLATNGRNVTALAALAWACRTHCLRLEASMP
jgi:Carboxypeptidase regulatory-like domain